MFRRDLEASNEARLIVGPHRKAAVVTAAILDKESGATELLTLGNGHGKSLV